MRSNLRDRFVFLAASYPAREFRERADSQEIASAVKALLATVFHARGKIVFGGHPSISPLALMMAREFREHGRIVIYQSEVFEGSLSEATLRLRDEGYGQIISTPIDYTEKRFLSENVNPSDFPKSLKAMREKMVSRAETNPAAAVFIGGDTGLFEERTVFSVQISEAPMYAVGAPGGAALEMAKVMERDNPSKLATKLATSRNYLSLMRDVVADIEGSLGKAMAVGR